MIRTRMQSNPELCQDRWQIFSLIPFMFQMAGRILEKKHETSLDPPSPLSWPKG